MIFEDIKQVLDFIKRNGLYPEIPTIEGAPTDTEVVVGGKKLLMFSSNNYLGLANHPDIKRTMIEAVQKYGMGSGGSRLVSGTTDVQLELEDAVAKFKGCETAMTFVTGYMANTGPIPALLNIPNISAKTVIMSKLGLKKKAAVFSDELNHASIIDGCRLAKVDRFVYKHRDVDDLEKKLKKAKRYKRKLIITDGIFSMAGDIAPLPQIMALGKKYKAMVYVDDAHATGVLGENGRGTDEYFHLEEKPDVVMGTFTKSFGGIGGFIAGSKDLIDYLRATARTYIFTAPIPPAVVAGLIKAVRIVEGDKDRIKKLWDNVNYVRTRLGEQGFNLLNSSTPIIPVLVGPDKKGIEVAKRMFEKGIFTPCVRWPAVPHERSILRVTIMTIHSREQIDKFVDTLIQVRKEAGF